MEQQERRPRILITQKVPTAAYTLLAPIGQLDTNQEEGCIWTPEELLARAPGYDYLFCLLTDTIDIQLLEACATATPRLKLVANMAVGYNNINLEAATRLGIAVTNTPGVLSETTADLAFGLLLATARRISESERYLRAGKFTGWGPLLFCGAEVHHATLGIIGAGRIGLEMAKRAAGFDMQVLYYNRQRLAAAIETTYHLTYVPFQDLLQRSDFVSLHLPYTNETHHLLGEQEFRVMKNSAILINTARGPIVDEQALVQALQAGQIAGAGLDVFEQEPLVSPDLMTMEQVVIVPHIGSASYATRTLMATIASQNIIAHIQGQKPPHQLNNA
ncbi:MAG TPA: D-glycerate dehydrogenase [Dictyobacter sp.]|jgi:glyoxylate reductase|nr:D-glycerate dehydrogenase [Dictyobacter sp.]